MIGGVEVKVRNEVECGAGAEEPIGLRRGLAGFVCNAFPSLSSKLITIIIWSR